MTRLTIANVNKALAAAGYEGTELLKGNGYFYFWGEEASGLYSSSVAVFKLSDIPTVEEWVDQYRFLRGEKKEEKSETTVLNLFCADLTTPTMEAPSAPVKTFRGRSADSILHSVLTVEGFANDEFPLPERGDIELPHGAIHLSLSDGEESAFDAFLISADATPEQIAEVQKKIDEA